MRKEGKLKSYVKIHTARNATEALAILNQGTPIDILFTDIVMPNGMNGIALAREARRSRPDIRVLLASGYSRNRRRQRYGLYRQAISDG